MIQILDEAACRKALEGGGFEIPPEGPAALILTQGWCPQWQAMKAYLPEAEQRLVGLHILYVEYDRLSCHEAFMAFKENTFNNREIPYVRYYRDGECTGEGNFVSLEGFLRRLGAD